MSELFMGCRHLELAHGGETVVVAVLEVDETLFEGFLECKSARCHPSCSVVRAHVASRIAPGWSFAGGRVNFRFRPPIAEIQTGILPEGNTAALRLCKRRAKVFRSSKMPVLDNPEH